MDNEKQMTQKKTKMQTDKHWSDAKRIQCQIKLKQHNE